MEGIQRFFRKIANLPDKKKYFEFITAFLSIPVLLSVVYINYLNIQEKTKTDKLSPTPQPTQTVITIIRDSGAASTPTKPTPVDSNVSDKECDPGLGPVSIINPEDNETITTNPLEIDVNYEQGTHCSAVWSYRINGGPWSDYGDRDIVIYNLPSGDKKLELRVKSIVSGEEDTITRTFTYKNSQEIPTPTANNTPTSTPSPSPTIQVLGTSTP